MASSPFEVEDQTDEDFFDKLVRDDDDDDDIVLNNRASSSAVSTSNIEANDFDEAKAFSSLSVSELVPAGVVDSSGDPDLKLEAEQGGQDGSSLGTKEEDEVSKESQLAVTTSNLVDNVNVNEFGEVGTGDEAALDKNNGDSAKGVKVVQWSSFSSDLDIHCGSGFGSGAYPDPFNELGNDSEDPFANLGNVGKDFNSVGGVPGNSVADLGSSSHRKNQDDGQYVSGAEQNAVEQDLSSSQQWENMYPGWRYDEFTGQWHQVDGYNAIATTQAEFAGALDANSQSASDVTVLEPRLDASYHLEQTAQSVVGNVAYGYTNDTNFNWNQSPQVNLGYPAHMVFDPQYPGWYYDTIVMEWKSLESYTPAVNQSKSAEYNQLYQSKTIENHGSHGKGNQYQVSSWGESMGNHNQQNVDALPAHLATKNEAAVFGGSHQLEDPYGPTSFLNNSADQDAGFKSSTSAASYETTTQCFSGNYEVPGFQSSNIDGRSLNHRNQIRAEPTRQTSFSSAYFAGQKSDSFNQQPLESGTQFYGATSEGRSPAGRPPHALVTFGFGGKLIVIKNVNSFHTHSSHNTEEPLGGVIHVLNLTEVVIDKIDASSYGSCAHDYFYTLCQQPFPGPLVGGSVSSKELIKWIDDQIGNFESPYENYRSREVVKLLFSLLKIACQHYGKLRSPFITDQGLKESDCPESAVANLFASAKSNNVQPSGYGTLSLCLQNSPSEAQMQATAFEVQKLLVSGKKREALECARQGQLWGLALAVASQLGDQFHGDILKQMALKQLVAGSPLQTLCLLISGNPAEVFSSVAASSNLPASQNMYQQPAQIRGNSMLDQWEENLAIVTANRTKGDELVIIHLGDCLWKERGEIIAAHICYLVAETNFEPYSDSARLCLIGADHWKFPRTYASPEAIQRTELYEYAKVLGNSQFLILPFQPYKLIYAYMLAEVGKLDDSLKYCQAILKSLKTSRVEMDTCRQLVSSLEERLRTHQQGGYGNNLAPTKLVGKLFTFFDSTAHRVVGGLPPTTSSTSHNSIQHNEYAYQSGDPKISTSQSIMATPSLMPSVSMEPISELARLSNQPTVPNRSISEPDFGKTPEKVNPSEESTEASSTKIQEKAPAPGRFGRFGSQLFQKTVGLVLRSRPDRQAKLGETNKFYYDEKLKRWVEEGAEPPTEETTIPPPPTTASFQSWMPDQNVTGSPESFNTNNGPEYRSPNSSDRSSGIPPMPPSSNQFSARGRMGVRGRYVDTFNKGGGTSSTLFQSPSALATKPGVGASNKFFIPTPVASGDDKVQKTEESTDQNVVTNENPSTSFKEESLLSPPASAPSSSMAVQQFPNIDNIAQKREVVAGDGSNSLPGHSRRAASWSGYLRDSSSPATNEIKHLGEAIGLSQSCDKASDP